MPASVSCGFTALKIRTTLARIGSVGPGGRLLRPAEIERPPAPVRLHETEQADFERGVLFLMFEPHVCHRHLPANAPIAAGPSRVCFGDRAVAYNRLK